MGSCSLLPKVLFDNTTTLLLVCCLSTACSCNKANMLPSRFELHTLDKSSLFHLWHDDFPDDKVFHNTPSPLFGSTKIGGSVMSVYFSGCIYTFFALKDISVMRLMCSPCEGRVWFIGCKREALSGVLLIHIPLLQGENSTMVLPPLFLLFSILFSAVQKRKSEGGRQRGWSIWYPNKILFKGGVRQTGQTAVLGF